MAELDQTSQEVRYMYEDVHFLFWFTFVDFVVQRSRSYWNHLAAGVFESAPWGQGNFHWICPNDVVFLDNIRVLSTVRYFQNNTFDF